MSAYSKTYEIRFSDIDANRHVNYAAYVDAAGDLRYHFFAEHGFPPERFEQLGMGPVYTRISIEFLREVRLGETVTISFAVTGLSPQGMRWTVHHDVLKFNGKKAVSIDMEGVLLDLNTRKPVPANAELLQVFNMCPRTTDFEVISELRRIR